MSNCSFVRALLPALSAMFVAFAAGAAEVGSVVEFDIPAKPGSKGGSTHEIVAGPDGNLWVTQQNQARIVRVTPQGVMTPMDLEPGSGPHGIEFDAAGNLWASLEFKNAIALLSRDGKVLREFPIPVKNAHPHGLGIGHDGKSVWWTGKAAGVLGRLDPATGAMKIFPLPRKDSTPIYIVAGPDGGMWFTELTGNRVGRINDAGDITEFKPPTSNSRPIAVLPGKDGTMWFTQEAGHSFAKLDARGKITEYRLATPTATPAGLAHDRDGTLWVQFNTPGKIARVRPDMTVEEFPIPTKKAVMHRIVAGPDGNLWFTELASDKIGYIITHKR